MLDLTEQRIVDSHCHPFLPEREPTPFGQCLTLSEHLIPDRDVASTFLYRRVIRELSRVLGFKGSSGEVIDERNRWYKSDPTGYIRILFEDAGIDTLLVDTGYPSDLDLEDFSKIIPCNIREIFRIETLSLELLRRKLHFDALIDEFVGRIEDAVGKGVVALKTAIAYNTGLEVRRRTDGEVRRAYEAFTSKAKTGVNAGEIIGLKTDYVKKILDHFVFLAAESSARLNVPFQIHVGMGAVPGIDLRLSKPSLLHELVNDEEVSEAKVVLTHGGYPHIKEAGFMINTYPNVYLDMSQISPFISIGLEENLRNLFEMAPMTKIMHGSDGYNIPELFWIAALQAKWALERVLSDLIERDEVDEEGARVIAAQFLSDNARRLYDL